MQENLRLSVYNNSMKPIYVVLIILLAVLQYQLWWADGGVQDLNALHQNLSDEKQRYQQSLEQNNELIAQIQSLKHNQAEVEAQAREEHNMVKEGEDFIQVVEE